MATIHRATRSHPLPSESSMTGGGPTVDDGIRAWFTDEDGSCILTLPSSPAYPSAPGSIIDVLPLGLPDLYNYVDQLEGLQGAVIASTESYARPIRQIRVIDHRFLVLELRRQEDPMTACLRLDRLRGKDTSVLRALLPSGESDANDRAMFTITGDVIQPGTRKNRQSFQRQPPLKHLRFMLQIVCHHLGGYSACKSNCWLFCSMIQQLLASAYKGSFECGKLQYRRRSRRLRKLALLEFLQLVCGTLSAAERESPQRESQQRNPVGYSPADADAARPGSSQLEEHQEHHAQDAHVAPRPLLNVQDRSRPGSVETVERQAASDSESQCQAPDSPSTCIRPSPTILHVNPNNGPVAGEIGIAVLGLHFPQSSRCFFGLEEAKIMEWKEGWLYCILPPCREPGPVDVTIRVGGTVAGHSPQHFVYRD